MRRLREHEHRVYETPAGNRLLDPVRMAFVVDGPEEYVRQDVIATLMTEYGYPVEALRSEEPIQRGGRRGGRGRADVIAYAPHELAHIELVERPPAEQATGAAYSMHCQAVATGAARIPGLRVVPIPDEIVIDVDGQALSGRVLGVTFVDGNYRLELQVPSEVVSARGLPCEPCVPVSGYGLSAREHALARSLGVKDLRWSGPESDALADAFAPWLAVLELSIDPDWGACSADRETGYVLLQPEDQAVGAVLCWFDARVAEPPSPPEKVAATSAEGDEETVEEPVSDPLVAPIDGRAVLVVECKADSVAYTQAVLAQGRSYAERLGARFLVLTAGQRAWTHAFMRDEEEWIEVDDIPRYDQITGDGAVVGKVAPAPWISTLPADAEQRPGCAWLHYRAGGFGAETPEEHWLPVLRLDEALRSPRPLVPRPIERYGVALVSDLGLHDLEVGNPAGGKWWGAYRCFLARLPGDREGMVGLAMMGKMKCVGDRTFGTTTSTNVLIGAWSVDAELHPVIELDIDRSLRLGKTIGLSHDGRITVGKGAVSPRKLKEHLQGTVPELLRDDRVWLGEWRRGLLEPSDLEDFLLRFTSYVIQRHAFKLVERALRKGARDGETIDHDGPDETARGGGAQVGKSGS